MLKTLAEVGILRLMRECQVAWKYGKTPNDWQTCVIVLISRIEIASNVRTTEKYLS